MDYTKVSSNKSQEEYIYLTPENRLTEESCRQLILEINEECVEHGYERIMINLNKQSKTFSVNTVFKASVSEEATHLLPFRIAWVFETPSWEKKSKSFNLVARNKSLPWRSFTQLSLAEEWLFKSREEALLD